MEEILKLINDYWKFDNFQGHASSWHDKQDLLEAVKKAKVFSSNNMLADSSNRCNECGKEIESGTVFCSPDCRRHYYSDQNFG